MKFNVRTVWSRVGFVGIFNISHGACSRSKTSHALLPSNIFRQPANRQDGKHFSPQSINMAQKESVLFKCATFLIPFLTFGLGMWQVERRKWKQSLIDNIEQRLSTPPIALRPHNMDDLRHDEYTRVNVRGYLDLDNIVFVGPRKQILHRQRGRRENVVPESVVNNSSPTSDRKERSPVSSSFTSVYGPPTGAVGFVAVAKLQLCDSHDTNGQSILVSLGWVPKEVVDAHSRWLNYTQAAGAVKKQTSLSSANIVELTGLIRHTEGAFGQQYNSGGRSVHRQNENVTVIPLRDHSFLSERLTTTEKDLLVDCSAECTAKLDKVIALSGTQFTPMGGQSRTAQLSNRHMEYVVTWFSMSALSAIYWFARYVVKR